MDAVALLLADPSPGVRYRALLEIDGASPEDEEVTALSGELDTAPEVTRALRAPGTTAIGLSFTLCRLAYAGLTRGQPHIDAIAQRIFRWQQDDGAWPDTGPGRAAPMASRLAPGEHYEWHPLHTALPLRGLAAAGFATDPRAERAYEWLLDRRVDDGTWAYGKQGREPDAVKAYRRMAGSEGCRAATTGALACFAHHPQRRTSPQARSALDVLLRRETREEATLGFEVSRLLGVERARGFETFYAVFDLAFVLDLASRIGVSTGDDRLARLVAFLESKRGRFGLWDHPVHPHLTRWLTLDILTSLRRIESGDWTGSGYRAPFTAYPKRRKRY